MENKSSKQLNESKTELNTLQNQLDEMLDQLEKDIDENKRMTKGKFIELKQLVKKNNLVSRRLC